MRLVPDPITVWMVRLERGWTAHDVKGTLSLEEDALVFTGSDERRSRFAFEHVRSAKRVRGSPVLIVTTTQTGTQLRTAFYFAQPPPMEPDDTVPTVGFSLMRRPKSKRRVTRENARYLQVSNPVRKPTIQAWADAVTERIRPAR